MTLKQRLGTLLFRHLPITRFLFDQLRVETNAGLRILEAQWSPRTRLRLSRLHAARGQLVNVACGPAPLPGFVNLDLHPASPEIIGWDCRRDLPLGDGAADGVRAEQFLEHLDPREELPVFLRNCHRVLKGGGILRIIVPDAERYLRAYCSDDLAGFRALGVPNPFPEDLPTRMDIINHVFHQWHEHRWGYDFETLEHRLHTAGFRDVRKMSFGVSLDPRLAADRPHHEPNSLYVDARR